MSNHFGRTELASRAWLALTLILLTAVGAVSQESGKTTSPPVNVTHVREFVAAFNARNIDAMLAAADDGIQWFNISDGKITIETEGKKALRENMENYFRGCPSCKSTLQWVQEAGSRVTALERASWTARGKQKSQSSLSVYEFSNGRILHVYYFPADVDPPSPAPTK